MVLERSSETNGEYALVTVNGEEYARLDLNKDNALTVSQDAGFNTIRVSNGKVYVESADCPDKICVDHTPVYMDGETIVCLPHKMVITVCSKKESDTDAVSQ